MYVIESRSTDPYYNLALEQYVFDRLDHCADYCMLWQNHNTIVIGKHQNTVEEINAAFIKERGITVVRRLSGGGAVYHDQGNVNFTFITSAEHNAAIDFEAFCRPIQAALRSFGVRAEFSGSNDITVDGKKISGNAQYSKHGRVMHHGTILYDCNLDTLEQALTPAQDKIQSKGIASIRSRVTNVRPYMERDMPTGEFLAALQAHLCNAFAMQPLPLTPAQCAEVETLRNTVYAQWHWNYGASPAYTVRKTRRVPGCGKIDVFLDIAQEGKIRSAALYGDFFSNRDTAELGALLAGCRLEKRALQTALAGADIAQYVYALDTETFITLLLE
jgi:lipoate-protein ligase A